MTVSEVDIANMALLRIGTRSEIQSLLEDSRERIAFVQCYETTRDEILRMAPWNFARKYQTLALFKAAPGTPENTARSSATWSSANPPPGWNYEYLAPSDMLAPRYVIPQFSTGTPGIPLTSAPVVGSQFPTPGDAAVQFIMGSDTNTAGNVLNVVMTNAQQAILCYTWRVTQTYAFDALFVQALADGCAAKMVVALSGNLPLSQALFANANRAITEARVRDGNDGLTVQETIPDWIKARGYLAYPAWNLNPYVMPYGPLYAVN